MRYCNHQNFGRREQHFSRTSSMDRSISSFVILRIIGMAGSRVLFYRQERMAGKGTRSDANERHANPYRTAQIAKWFDQNKRFRFRVRCRIRVRAHGMVYSLFLFSRFLPCPYPYLCLYEWNRTLAYSVVTEVD